MTLHMQVKSDFLQLLLKNKLTNFTARVSEAVRGLFLPPAKKGFLKNINKSQLFSRIHRNKLHLIYKTEKITVFQLFSSL